MAEIVAVYPVPHTPSFVAEALLNGPRSRTLQLFSQVRAHLEAARPELIVTVNNDHFNTFFFDNWPTFAIGIADGTAGPNDQTPGMPWYELSVSDSVARHTLRCLVADGYDFASTLEFEVDHGVLVPLHFMTPGMDLPIIPIFINCTVPSLPPTRRCYALGRSIAGALRAVTEFERIAVIASGSLSLEIGGPRAFTDQTFGVPDPEWASWILDRVRHCEHDRLIEAATEERMLAAGNVAGELLNWIIALGITGRRTPDLLLDQPGARKPSG